MSKVIFQNAVPYGDDALNLPVEDVEAAIPYYEKTFGFRVVVRHTRPFPSVILERDGIRIGLAQNGGDPTQEGCFFEVDNVDAAFEEMRGKPAPAGAIGVEEVGGELYRAFFDVAPDGLCYMIAQPK